MKATKIIVILVILAAAGTGFFFHQKNKRDKALAAHNEQKFEKIKEAAKKSSSAGLLNMASILNKFHKEKGRYPTKLFELYPDYIADETFISTLNWQYEPGKNTFRLKRGIKGKSALACIGPDLKMKYEKSGQAASPKRVASIDLPKPQKLPILSHKPKKDRARQVMALNQFKKQVDTTPQKNQTAYKKATRPDPGYTIEKKELDPDENFLLSLNGNGLYIWKTHDGSIGFSNIQYPDEKNLTIYKDRSWLRYKKIIN